MIDEIYKSFSVSDDPEITLEANPDDLSKQRIKSISKTAINRLSIGIQSFFDHDLQSMNRAHSASEGKECLEHATKYFDNITIDLIYGIPDMNLEKWNKNLQTVFEFGIPHISSYALTVEPKTALEAFIKKGTYPPIDEELALKHFNYLIRETENKGFVQYEISNFGKPGYFSKHNASYWKGRSYLGIGPSAHSFNGKQRSWNVSNNTKYIQLVQNHELPLTIEDLSTEDRYNEYVMTGLRTIWGISTEKVQKEFGFKFKEHLLEKSARFVEEGFLEINENIVQNNEDLIIKTSQKGKFLADGIASDLFVI